MNSISRRGLGLMVAGGASALALSACTSTGGALSSTATTVLQNVATALSAAANGLSGAVSGLATATGIVVPADVVADLTGSLNFLTQLSTQVLGASNADAATLVQKGENYLNAALAAANKLMAIPGLSTLVPFLGTAIGAATVLAPFLEAAINYLVGQVSTAPSLTAVAAPTTAAAKFGAASLSPAQAITRLQSFAKAP